MVRQAHRKEATAAMMSMLSSQEDLLKDIRLKTSHGSMLSMRGAESFEVSPGDKLAPINGESKIDPSTLPNERCITTDSVGGGKVVDLIRTSRQRTSWLLCGFLCNQTFGCKAALPRFVVLHSRHLVATLCSVCRIKMRVQVLNSNSSSFELRVPEDGIASCRRRE